jgi:hypothetical protein
MSSPEKYTRMTKTGIGCQFIALFVLNPRRDLFSNVFFKQISKKTAHESLNLVISRE